MLQQYSAAACEQLLPSHMNGPRAWAAIHQADALTVDYPGEGVEGRNQHLHATNAVVPPQPTRCILSLRDLGTTAEPGATVSQHLP